jgi:hypothetical protein
MSEMTDRLKGLIVTFEKDIRDDDAQSIIDAILMVKGVLSVTTSISTSDDSMNRIRIRHELKEKLFEALE